MCQVSQLGTGARGPGSSSSPHLPAPDHGVVALPHGARVLRDVRPHRVSQVLQPGAGAKINKYQMCSGKGKSFGVSPSQR